VPIAIRSRRLDRVWIIPALLALPIPTSGGNALVILWGLGVGTATFVALLRPALPSVTACPAVAGPVAGVRV
jgi:hypothetical protein